MSPANTGEATDVTFVVTSCGRSDLLKQTIDSFLAFNTYPIAQFIVIEDSGDQRMVEFIEREFPNLFDQVLFNDPPILQLPSIDRAYAAVKTPYVFHCEDDWEFYRKGFIEDSLALLNEMPEVINVWLRGHEDTNGHPLEDEVHSASSGIAYRYLVPGYDDQWYGFTLNPTLKRMSDYQKVQPYAQYGSEGGISLKYRDLGYTGVILENSALRHIGHGRHVPRAGEKLLRTLKYKIRNWRNSRL